MSKNIILIVNNDGVQSANASSPHHSKAFIDLQSTQEKIPYFISIFMSFLLLSWSFYTLDESHQYDLANHTIKDKPHIPSYYFLCALWFCLSFSFFCYVLVNFSVSKIKKKNFSVSCLTSLSQNISLFALFLILFSWWMDLSVIPCCQKHSAVRDQHLLSNNLKLAAFTVYLTVFLKWLLSKARCFF